MLQLRYIGIPHGEHEIPGVCICGDTKSEVLDVANMALQYYEAPGLKPIIQVAFKKNREGTFDFLMDFGIPVGNIDIRGVEAAIPERVERGLESFEGFFILLGYGTEDFSLVDSHTFHMVRSEIELDGKIVQGSKKLKVNISDLVKSMTPAPEQSRKANT